MEMIIVIPEAIALYYCNSSLHFTKMISTDFLCNDIVQLHGLWITKGSDNHCRVAVFSALQGPLELLTASIRI